MSAIETDELDQILANEAITPVYQQLVDLRSGLVVGFEALARGPRGSALENPGALFRAARAAGKLRQLDWTCRTLAVRGALGGKLVPPLSLFLNCEPDMIGTRVSADFAESWARARLGSLPLIFEVTERAVLDRPAQLLRAVDHIREFGWGVALDDVGNNPESLALLPFVEPDVIKLDMGLLHGTNPDAGEVALAVNAEAERTGATILAEGIETAAHLDLALAFGATIGQGWYFGRPAPLPDRLPEAGDAIPLRRQQTRPDPHATPHSVLTSHLASRRLTEEQLVAASRLIERRAAALPHPPLLVAAFQHADRFRGRSKQLYEELARRLPFVAVLAEGWEGEFSSRPLYVPLRSGDPLINEWVVGAISPFSGMLMAARERDPEGSERTFDVVMTFDRDRAREAADVLLQRLDVADRDDEFQEDVEFVVAVTEILSAAEREQDLVRPLLRVMSELTGLQSTFLSRVHDDERYDVVVSYNSSSEVSVAEGYSMPWTETICHDALTLGRMAFDDVQAELPDNRVGPDFGFRSYVTCPVLREDGKVAGTLCGASSHVEPLTQDQLNIVRRFARLVGSRISETPAG